MGLVKNAVWDWLKMQYGIGYKFVVDIEKVLG